MRAFRTFLISRLARRGPVVDSKGVMALARSGPPSPQGPIRGPDRHACVPRSYLGLDLIWTMGRGPAAIGFQPPLFELLQ